MGFASGNFFETAGIAKSYQHRPVLSSVDFSLKSGECVALIGPNGAGKTTLLKILAGIIRPDRGRSALLDSPMFGSSPEYRNHLVFWGHQALAYPAFSGIENIDFFLKLRSIRIRRQEIIQSFEAADIDSQSNDPVRNYSAGMLQRLNIIRLSLTPWSLALLDEPTSGLDASGLALLNRYFDDWTGREKTILFTSHDADWTAARADRILVLQNGKITEDLQSQSAADLKTMMTELR